MKLVDRLLIGKDGIQMSEMMTFPDTWEEFEKLYGFNDAEEIYTNNSRLIPSFRVKQWLDHLSSVQQEQLDCEDCIKHGGDWECDRVHCHKGDDISRQAAIDAICEHGTDLERRGVTVLAVANHKQVTVDLLEQLPSVQPRKGKWMPDNTNYYDERYICSECNANYKVDTCMGKPSWNFCPNCGSYNGGDSDEKD